MDFGRVAVAAFTAWVVFLLVSYLLSPILLGDFSRQHAALLRPAADQPAPLGFGAALLGFFVFAYAYAKGYEGGKGPAEGLRFGVIVGLLLASFSTAWAYVLLPISGGFALALVTDVIVEMAIYGAVVGLIYRPLPVRTPDRR
jgi:hypothetical protein